MMFEPFLTPLTAPSMTNAKGMMIMTEPNQYNELFKALIKAQSEFPEVKKTRRVKFNNVHYNYADLDDLVNAARPVLAKNNLGFLHRVNTNESGATFVECHLLHQSGQSIKCAVRVDLPKDPKQAGSLITYFKRYSLEAMLGITTNEDDDGSVASQNVSRETPKAQSALITEPQRKRLFAIVKEKGVGEGLDAKEQNEVIYDLIKNVLKKHNVKSSKEITKASYNKLVAAIQASAEMYAAAQNDGMADKQ